MSSHGIPEVLMKKVDEYVDSLAPQIQPRIAQELDIFQQKTIDSLEEQVIDAFRSLFNKNRENSENRTNSRGLDNGVPDAYGGQSLPFADEISDLSRRFSNIAGEAGDDLRDIFNLSETRGAPEETRSRGGGQSDNFRGFLSAAVQAVQDHLDDNGRPGQQGFQLDGLLGVISNTVKDAARNPEEKARLISPEIKDKVGAKLREQHAPIAEQFTRIALDHIKRWLRGNTSTRDLGDGVKGEIEDQVKDLVKGLGGLFKNKEQPSQGGSRGFDDQARDEGGNESGGGFSKVISEKLSTGLARVHREVRLEFRKVLGVIEKQLFELLPDQFQRPLEKILGGNPFDSQLDREAGSQADRGFGDDIKAKLVDKIRGLVRKVQEALRESILSVVNGGHRKFERESWVFVQNMVEQKVQKYLPKVKISVPDDIGNEGVSVGAPTSNVQLGGGHQQVPQNQANPVMANPVVVINTLLRANPGVRFKTTLRANLVVAISTILRASLAADISSPLPANTAVDTSTPLQANSMADTSRLPRAPTVVDISNIPRANSAADTSTLLRANPLVGTDPTITTNKAKGTSTVLKVGLVVAIREDIRANTAMNAGTIIRIHREKQTPTTIGRGVVP
ncbi:hypothetical protein NEMBOFW57_003576 [Staphylotrichum longicolle]|uniref:Uncharacterized protein n=1 Tax=Staphylotrichum longicolle TaxID=669026 RepID=A0AAD4HZN2_9PEZI|nr:hypothetical protein NEMBOFW57_003576 [Staphylotrichum longicolle]